LLLIADTDAGSSGAANKVTVQKLLNDTLTNGTYTNAQLSGNLNVTQLSTLGTISSTRGTIATLNSTTGTITGLNTTTGTIATLNSTTGTITGLSSTNGTIATLNSTTGTIPTLVSITNITSGTGTAAAPAISPTGDTNTGIFFPAADTIALAEGGAEAMRIDASGVLNVLTTGTETGAINGFQLLSPGGNGGLTIYSSAASRDQIQLKNSVSAGTTSGSTCAIGVSSGDLYVKTAATERLRIASAGQIGIGGANYGTSGQVLTSAGAAAAPSWTTISTTVATGSVTFQTLSTSVTEADNVASRVAKAWVNFDGTTNVAGNCTIRADFNVSTVADNGTGDYTINFSASLPSANYSCVGASSIAGGYGTVTWLPQSNSAGTTAPLAGSLRGIVTAAGVGVVDSPYVNVAFFV
jgi:hypothetical protein